MQEVIEQYPERYDSYWLLGMRAKLGISNEEVDDRTFVVDLLNLMKQHHADFTNTFRALTIDRLEEVGLFRTPEFTEWNGRWQARLCRQQESKVTSQQLMRDSDPAVIPRNHLVEATLEAAVQREDYSVMERLLDVLSNPLAHSPEQAVYATLPATTTPYRTYYGT